MPEDGPRPIGEDLDVLLYRLIDPALGERYEDLKQEIQLLLDEEKKSFKQALHFLKRRRAKPEEIRKLREDSAAERRRIQDDFTARINALLDEVLGKREDQIDS